MAATQPPQNNNHSAVCYAAKRRFAAEPERAVKKPRRKKPRHARLQALLKDVLTCLTSLPSTFATAPMPSAIPFRPRAAPEPPATSQHHSLNNFPSLEGPMRGPRATESRPRPSFGGASLFSTKTY